MARPGITKQEVFNAANQLVEQGKDPTIEQVRQILKTGSHSTIAVHLRDWRHTQSDTQALAVAEGLPHDMVTMVKGLWDRLTAQAGLQVDEIEHKYQQAMSELHQDLQKYRTNNQRWQQLFSQWQQDKEKLSANILTMKQHVESLQSDKIALEGKINTQYQQLQEKRERVEELHQLHTQSQHNLEHFRESVREQRLLEQGQFEQQKQELQLEIKTLKDELIVIREKALAAQQQYDLIRQTYEALEKMRIENELTLENQSQRINTLENEKAGLHETCQHWETRYKEEQITLKEKAAALIEAHTEARVLSRQLDDAKVMVAALQDQNRLLGHEKWSLVQEKAQLEGQLKQMQKIIA